MKKILLLIIPIALLAVSCHKQQPQNNKPANPADNNPFLKTPYAYWNSIGNQTDNYEVYYPKGDQLYLPQDKNKISSLGYMPVCDTQHMSACIVIPKEAYASSTFDGAAFSVNLLKNYKSKAKCENLTGTTNKSTTAISGQKFQSGEFSNGAAGHVVTGYIYRNFHLGTCYDLTLSVYQTNPGVYPPGTVGDFTQDDKNKVMSDLTAVLNTFHFIKN